MSTLRKTFRKSGGFDFSVSAIARQIEAAGPLPRLPGLFITGTDTEVGKTLIAGGIARCLRGRGRRVEVMKPVATGCRHSREGLVSADAEFLAVCADSQRPLAEIAPVRYRSAVAPTVAAEREHRPVDLEAIVTAWRGLEGRCDCVIVEGIGGLLCPIRDDFWVIHLAKLLGLPLVVVARAGIGTINHTLLTLHAARSAALAVAGVVVNRYVVEAAAAEELADPQRPYTRGDEDLAVWTNPRQIAKLGGTELLALVPAEKENSVERATIGPNSEYAIRQVNWEELMGL
jgi:dethiobiotin synthetase